MQKVERAIIMAAGLGNRMHPITLTTPKPLIKVNGTRMIDTVIDGKIDWMITLVPLAIVIALCVLFFFAPEQSNAVLSKIRFFFGDTFGTYYLTMIAFYATSFDSIALTASCYSYHRLGDNEQPNKGIQLMWCILLILLPIALLFAESSMNNLQSVSIVAAFPIGAVIVMIAVSFMKDAKKYMENLEKSAKEKGEK